MAGQLLENPARLILCIFLGEHFIKPVLIPRGKARQLRQGPRAIQAKNCPLSKVRIDNIVTTPTRGGVLVDSHALCAKESNPLHLEAVGGRRRRQVGLEGFPIDLDVIGRGLVDVLPGRRRLGVATALVAVPL